jgi:hypothetical protein
MSAFAALAQYNSSTALCLVMMFYATPATKISVRGFMIVQNAALPDLKDAKVPDSAPDVSVHIGK